jgi:orotate phosphoribosyltransferase/outer membrane protein assembly factor BamB
MHDYPHKTPIKAQSYIKELSYKKALMHKGDLENPILTPTGMAASWFFDFRLAMSDREFLKCVSTLFWEHFDTKERLQIGGLESAALPLVTSIVLTGENTSGFYIRKSRKKKMQMRQIEGEVDNDEKIILVDDLTNTGSSFKKQIEILKKDGITVSAIFTILAFHDADYYTEFRNAGIEVVSLFTIEDFDLTLQMYKKDSLGTLTPLWYDGSKKPHLFEQGPKHIPHYSNGDLFVTSDSGYLRKIKAEDGTHQYDRKLVYRVQSTKTTITSSVMLNELIYLTTFRGALITVNSQSGLPVDSQSLVQAFTTPLCALDHILIFGSTHGAGTHVHKMNFYNTATKEIEHSIELPHGAARNIYIDTLKKRVFFADTRNTVHAYTIDGTLLWSQELKPERCIGVALNEYGELVSLTSTGTLTVFNNDTGKIKDTHALPAFHYSMPIFKGDLLYAATLDREVYCYNYITKKTEWSYETKGRMYSAPTLYKKYLLVGDNFGQLHVIDRQSGKKVLDYIVSERITNPVIVTDTKIILSTFANELYVFQNILNEQLPKEHAHSHQNADHDSSNRA